MTTTYWVIYWIGVVVFPIVVGMMMGGKGNFKVFDEGIPIFLMSFVWPFVLVVIAGAMLILAVAALAGTIGTFLMTLGSSIGRKLETPPKKEEVLTEDGQKDK